MARFVEVARRQSGPWPCWVCETCRGGQRRFVSPAHHDFSMFPAWWAGAGSELVPPYIEKRDGLGRQCGRVASLVFDR